MSSQSMQDAAFSPSLAVDGLSADGIACMPTSPGKVSMHISNSTNTRGGSTSSTILARREDFRFRTGTGRYTDDINLPRQLYAAFVRSDQAQTVLAKNRIERATGVLTKHPSLLTGLVFDDKGKRLTPTYAVKKGTRYRYYISTATLTGKGPGGIRIPAGNLDFAFWTPPALL
jgi:hypothetical protein